MAGVQALGGDTDTVVWMRYMITVLEEYDGFYRELHIDAIGSSTLKWALYWKIYFIMLLQLSQFSPFASLYLVPPFLPAVSPP